MSGKTLSTGQEMNVEEGSWPSLINSVMASVISTLLVLVLAFPAAYALSIRPVRKWSDVLFFLLSTKFLPIVAGLLPIYLFAKKVGMFDDIWLLIIFYTVMNLPIAIWMLRSFLAEVPSDSRGRRGGRRRLDPDLRQGGRSGGHAGPGLGRADLFHLQLERVALGSCSDWHGRPTTPVYLTGFVAGQGLFLAKVCAASLWCRCRCLSPVSPHRTSWCRVCRWGRCAEPCQLPSPCPRPPSAGFPPRWPGRHTTGLR